MSRLRSYFEPYFNGELPFPTLGATVVLVAILGILVLSTKITKEREASQDGPEGTSRVGAMVAAPPKVSETVSATALHLAYVSNATTATDRFEGRYLVVTGKIAGINKTSQGLSMLTIEDGAKDSPIVCTFASETTPGLSDLHSGQVVSVKGRFGRTEDILFMDVCTLR